MDTIVLYNIALSLGHGSPLIGRLDDSGLADARLTFLLVFLSANGLHPFLFLLRSLGQENEPLVLGKVVNLPAIDNCQTITVEISCIR